LTQLQIFYFKRNWLFLLSKLCLSRYTTKPYHNYLSRRQNFNE